ncbi:MAG: ribulokinase [Flavisolibacter sp.]
MMEPLVIGVDYGTDSVRSIIVNAVNGKEIASAIFNYPRWSKGLYCNPDENQFRQHPLDYLEGLESTIKNCLTQLDSNSIAQIKAISIDTTGSTPVPVNEKGIPLALLPEFEDNPNAMFVLWKDHTSIKEASEINDHIKNCKVDYLKYVGGIYSSEWFWAKLLHIIRKDSKIKTACYSWVEHCDWIPFLLTGGTEVSNMKRSVCAAGHKALWSNEWNGLPPDSFFSGIDPILSGFRARLYDKVYTSAESAGTISSLWSKKLGLPADTKVGIGAFDAHMGAVGGQIEPYYLSKVMGTSTCDILVAPESDVKGKLVHGICGQVPGSVIPGMLGMEAGQSAFGDIYAWFKDLLCWPLQNLKNEDLKTSISDNLIKQLSDKASELPISEDDELSIDWLNGRRTPDANQIVKGAIINLNLASDPPSVFKSLVEGTCFGAKAIVERFRQQGIQIKGLIGLGGVAKKSPYVMQVIADVVNMRIRIHRSDQTCAMGAAMFAATVAGIYPKVENAMRSMGQGFDKEYIPDPKKSELYNKRYQRYLKLGSFIENHSSIAIKVS